MQRTKKIYKNLKKPIYKNQKKILWLWINKIIIIARSVVKIKTVFKILFQSEFHKTFESRESSTTNIALETTPFFNAVRAEVYSCNGKDLIPNFSKSK